MRFEHCDGDRSPNTISLGAVRDDADIESDGSFVVDEEREDFDAVRDRLEAAGHTPIDETPRDEAIKDNSDGQEDDHDPPKASDFDESQLVAHLDYREKQAIAKQYDDIDGSASSEKLTEELIKKRREEVDD